MSLTKRDSGTLATSETATSTVGKYVTLAGVGSIPVAWVASLLPFGVLVWAVLFIVFGAIMYVGGQNSRS